MINREEAAEEIFGAALELAPERRAAFLDAACRTAPDLRQLVEELLKDGERMGSFMQKPLLKEDDVAFRDLTPGVGFPRSLPAGRADRESFPGRPLHCARRHGRSV